MDKKPWKIFSRWWDSYRPKKAERLPTLGLRMRRRARARQGIARAQSSAGLMKAKAHGRSYRVAKAARAEKAGERGGFSFPDWGRKAIITSAIVLVALIAGAYWWFHPPINIHSSDCWVFLAIFVLLPLFLVFKAARRIRNRNG